MKFNFTKPTRPVLASLTVSYKSLLGGRFWYMFAFKEVNICDLSKMYEKDPMLKPIMEFANATFFKNAIRGCPYEYVDVENAYVSYNASQIMGNVNRFPNGFFKISIKLFNRKVDNMITMNWTLINKWRDNDVEGNDKF